MDNREHFFIGNAWTAPTSGRRFEIANPSTGEIIGHVPEAVEADVDAAVAAARAAFPGWSATPPAQRAAIMRRLMDAMMRRAPEIAHAVSVQNGMPIALSTGLEGGFPAAVVGYYADLADALGAEDYRPNPDSGTGTLVERAPVGVVAAIVPWNFPVTLAISKIAPAMATGCTMVIKPSPGTVYDSYILAEAALEAGVPAGVLNWVAADRAVGAYLVTHPDVDKVAFTGSTAGGRAVARACGDLLRPVTLELGGKSAAILLDDADLDLFASSLPSTAMLNNGQTCFNTTRILAPRGRYDTVVDSLADAARALVVGDALDLATQVGPMASESQRSRVEEYIALGRAEGRLVVGGGRPAGHNGGWFVEPTVFADVDNQARIAREEIFGPVLVVIPYDSEEEAVAIANDSDFGLGGAVWSADRDRATAIARRVASGTVGVNGYQPALGAPFGGIKASGMGREFGPEVIGAYQNLKSIYLLG